MAFNATIYKPSNSSFGSLRSRKPYFSAELDSFDLPSRQAVSHSQQGSVSASHACRQTRIPRRSETWCTATAARPPVHPENPTLSITAHFFHNFTRQCCIFLGLTARLHWQKAGVLTWRLGLSLAIWKSELGFYFCKADSATMYTLKFDHFI